MSGPSIHAVVNPAKVRRAARLRTIVDGALAARGLPPARYLLTTVERPGAGQAQDALDAGASRVLVAGGDGTVRMVLGALQGTGVPVGILPAGTGNVLARNLGLPRRLREAVDVALDGRPLPMDLLRYEVPGTGASGYAAIMAGLGADAAVVADAEPVKRFGQLGYMLAGLRHVRTRPVRTRVSVDGEELTRDASLVEVGNFGELLTGLHLLPGAEGSDGRLDVLVASPRRRWEVLRMAAGVLLRSNRIPQVDRRAGRSVVVRCAEPVPCQVDGDLIGAVTEIRFEVLPGAASVACR